MARRIHPEHAAAWLGASLAWLKQRDLVLVAGVACLAALAWGFFEIAEEISDPETLNVDRAVLLALRKDPAGEQPIGPDWLARAALDLSALGSGAVVTTGVIAAVGYLLLAGRPKLALLLGACSAGSGALVVLLKNFFQRARPDVVVPVLPASGLSFPSGHALLSAALYPTLGVLLALAVRPRRLRLYVIGVAVLFAFLIGATRVYLGVHYPTDVLAGWTVGLAWALGLGLIARRLQQRGMVEPAAKNSHSK